MIVSRVLSDELDPNIKQFSSRDVRNSAEGRFDLDYAVADAFGK